MEATLWIAAGLLAFAFTAAGLMKISKDRDQLVASGQGWAEDFSPGTVRLIGTLEVLAAIGLVVPPLVDVAPMLAPLAASGLALLMLGAAITHARRGEGKNIIVNVALGGIALFVAVCRFGPYAF